MLRQFLKGSLLFVLLSSFVFGRSQAQVSGYVSPELPTIILPHMLEVGYSLTTNIIFPYEVFKADIGSPDVIALKIKGMENVLLVKADRKDFTPTNLSVYTKDGRFYSYMVSYNNSATAFNYSYKPDPHIQFSNDTATGSRLVSFTDSPGDAETIQSDADTIGKRRFFLRDRAGEQRIGIALKSIYLKDNLLWFTYRARNRSMIQYLPGYIRMYVTDRKKVKRTATQELDLKPLYISPKWYVPGKSKTTLVVAYRPFTIPKGKRLVFQISEADGGRTLDLEISAKELLKTRE